MSNDTDTTTTTTGPSPVYGGTHPGRSVTPLSYRAEWRRQIGRPRTRWIAAIVVALPLVFLAAFALGDDSDNNSSQSTTGQFVDLATLGALNFALFTLLVSSTLLLIILATVVVGDPVPAEASWGSLRYLLTAPVPRARLLTAKLSVGLTQVAVILVALPGWAYLVGLVAYGSAPLRLPGGAELATGDLLPRVAVMVGYLFITVLPVAGVAFLVGVATSTPLAAVGAATLVSIVSSILDTIDALGSWRKALPSHYSRAWLELLSDPIDWTDLQRGALWSLLWATLLFAAAYWRFQRRDVLS